MSSTDPNARDTGNYVMFDDIAPDGAGNLTLTLTFEMQGTPGVTDSSPALNALQLVRIVPPLPTLTIVRNVNGTVVTISWNVLAAGYTLESSGQLGAGAIWDPVGGVANPIAAGGSTAVNTTGGARFFRLHKQ